MEKKSNRYRLYVFGKMNIMKRITAIVMAVAMIVTLAPQSLLETFGVKTEAEAAVTLSNPKKVTDSSMTAGQKVTWDCVWFGEYPQTEIVDQASTSGCYGRAWASNSDYVVSESLYAILKNATYDANGDTKIGTTRYRRLRKSDATYSSSSSSDYYNWADSDTYHYFRYDPIKWRVLNVSDGKALLLADKVLDVKKYNTSYADVTWETCTIRSWLNGYGSSANVVSTDYSSKNFIDSAFGSGEQNAIFSSTVVNDDNIKYSTEGGNNTTDKIFLLSESEVYNTETAQSYGFVTNKSTYDEARGIKSSPFAKAMGTCGESSASYLGNCVWWLRSPGSETVSAAYIGQYGNVHYAGFLIDEADIGCRPALNLNLSSNLYTSAGTVCSDGKVDEIPASGSGGSTEETDTEDDVTYSEFSLTPSVTTNTIGGTASIYGSVTISVKSADQISSAISAIEWKSDNSDVVEYTETNPAYDSGTGDIKVTLSVCYKVKDYGSANITGTTPDGQTARCHLEIEPTMTPCDDYILKTADDTKVDCFTIEMEKANQDYLDQFCEDVTYELDEEKSTGKVEILSKGYTTTGDGLTATFYLEVKRSEIGTAVINFTSPAKGQEIAFNIICKGFNKYKYIADKYSDSDDPSGKALNAEYTEDKPCERLVEAAKEDGVESELVAWTACENGFKYASDGGTAVMSTISNISQSDIYASIILQMLEDYSTNEIPGLATDITAESSTFLDNVLGAVNNTNEFHYTSDTTLKQFMDDGNEELVHSVAQSQGLLRYSGAISKISEYADYAVTIKDYAYKLVAYENMRESSSNMLNMLKRMKSNTSNADLSSALTKCINIMEMTEAQYSNWEYMKNMATGAKISAQWSMNRLWDVAIDVMSPTVLVAKYAIKGGYFISDLVSGTSSLSEKYYRMYVMNEIQTCVEKTYASYKSSYKSSNTVENAINYIAAAECLMQCSELNCDIAKDYCEVMTGSIAGRIQTKLGTSSAAEAISSIDSIKNSTSLKYQQILTNWINDLALDYPEEYEKYKGCLTDSIDNLKKYVIECPVDVYVYDSDNNLAASIVDGKVYSNTAIAFMDGEAKTFYMLAGEEYHFEYKGTGTGTMDIQILEYNTSGVIVKESSFASVPLTDGCVYTSTDDGTIASTDSYSLKDDSGNVIKSDYESTRDSSDSKYSLTINNGFVILKDTPYTTLDVSEGQILTIKAGTEEGKLFKKWNIVSGSATINDATSQSTTILVKEDTVIEAVYEIDESTHTHTWNEGEITKQPTTNEEGVKTYTCTVCGKTKTEAIAKLQPSGSSESTQPTVTVPGITLKSVKNVKGKKLAIKWQKNTGVNGYVVQISTKKNFSSSVIRKVISNNQTTSLKSKALKKKKTYYVRVCSYKLVNGQMYYSAWSKVKKVKIKK